MVECSTTVKDDANGAEMIENLSLRLKELKGRNLPMNIITKAIGAAVDLKVRQARELKDAEERAAAAARHAQRGS